MDLGVEGEGGMEIGGQARHWILALIHQHAGQFEQRPAPLIQSLKKKITAVILEERADESGELGSRSDGSASHYSSPLFPFLGIGHLFMGGFVEHDAARLEDAGRRGIIHHFGHIHDTGRQLLALALGHQLAAQCLDGE